MNEVKTTAGKTGGGLVAEAQRFIVQWGLASAIGLVIFVAYFVVSITPSGSIAAWLMQYWSGDPDYSHGFLIPLISVGLIAYRWRELPKAKPDSQAAGLITLGVAMALYWAGIKAQRPHFAALSFVVLVFGLFLYFGGWRMTKAVSFAIAFLLFMVPMRFFLDRVAFDLRILVSIISTVALKGLGMAEVDRRGTTIIADTQDPNSALEVADPCSGIRSLVMLAALASLYGYLTLDKRWKKWTLFFLAAPLAVGANVIRITTIALIGRAFGYGAALHVYHNWSGFIVFAVAVISLVSVGLLMSANYPRLFRQWISEPVAPRRRAVLQQAAHK